jgi:hypothetical protein
MRKRVGVAGCAALIAALAPPALAASPRELPTLPERSPRHDVTPRGDGPRPLPSGTYAANLFPFALRVTVPAGRRGGQGQSRQFEQPSPSFGWVVPSRGTGATARGAITFVAPFGRSPSVAAVVAGLRSRGRGATYGPVTPVKIAGSSGSQFDGSVAGQGHVFIPFSPPQHVAAFYADAFPFDPGEAFWVAVLDVRRRTVVFFIESASLPAEQFPAFISAADQILASLRFPL